MNDLFPYQNTGAAFLRDRRAAFLADEPGLGKSAQAIVAANAVAAGYPVLVICPATVRSAWANEIARFGNGPKFTVISYDAAVRHRAHYMTPWAALILDEAHFLKTPTAARSKAIYGTAKAPGIASMAGHVWCLSGTPAPNSPVELWTHMAALFPDALRMASDPARHYDHFRFQARYCKTVETPFGTKIVGAKNLDDLKTRLAPYLLRRGKAEVMPDLPAIRYEPLMLDSSEAAKALAAIPDTQMQMARKALEHGDAEALGGLANSLAELRRITAAAKAALLVDWVREFLDGSARKIVIYGWHRAPLDLLANAFPNAAVIHGGTTDRGAPVRRFQEDPNCRVFIGQIVAAGTGITLTAASDLLFIEQSWTPSDNAQVAMRIHRIGQKDGCLVRYACLAGSIDEAVERVVGRKTRILMELFD